MSNPSLVNINPALLKWAREESGYSAHDLADKLSVEQQRYDSWETTGMDVPFATLRQASALLKRQVAVFFLPSAPPTTKRPTDYRNLSPSGGALSFETLLAIRRTARFRAVLLELKGHEHYERLYDWLSGFPKEPLLFQPNYQMADELRTRLDYLLDEQLRDKTINDSYRHWRYSCENQLGIHVFQFAMPSGEVQGFSYADHYPYCIVVNGRYSVASRIFTLCHELAHILTRQSGLCLPDEVEEDQKNELECNSFAGAFLVPDSVVARSTSQVEILKKARKLKVSSEVYLRRQRSLGLVSNEEFLSLLQEIRASVKPSGESGFQTPVEKSMNSRGQSLFDSVLHAVTAHTMSYESAADVLGLKIEQLLVA